LNLFLLTLQASSSRRIDDGTGTHTHTTVVVVSYVVLK
jgi:hypothetical protein